MNIPDAVPGCDKAFERPAEHGRQRLFDGPFDCGSDDRLHDGPSRLQRHDPWANSIVATRCKLVNYGAHIWWPQRPEPPVMPLERFAELPQNEMTADVRRMAKWFWDRSTRQGKPDRDDGFADGADLLVLQSQDLAGSPAAESHGRIRRSGRGRRAV